jgi:hypothetical protein
MPVCRGGRRVARLVVFVVVPLLASCGGGNCFLGLHDKFPVHGTLQCCGGAFHEDISVSDRGGSAEFDLFNTLDSGPPSDGFLVPRSCEKLFDGPYPGSRPLCDVLLGPAVPGLATAHIKLKTGVYRVWIQPYSSNTDATDFWVELGQWDHRCMSPLT